MFIAHLPSGYLLARALPALSPLTFWVMLGSVLPDLDMLYFYLIDAGATHHHSYLTHRPLVWVLLLALSIARSAPRLHALATGGILHLLLDSFTGAIAWGWPIWETAYPLIKVPPTQNWWVMSFVLHWSFVGELLICGLCGWVCLRRPRSLPPKRDKASAMVRFRRHRMGFIQSPTKARIEPKSTNAAVCTNGGFCRKH